MEMACNEDEEWSPSPHPLRRQGVPPTKSYPHHQAEVRLQSCGCPYKCRNSGNPLLLGRVSKANVEGSRRMLMARGSFVVGMTANRVAPGSGSPPLLPAVSGSGLANLSLQSGHTPRHLLGTECEREPSKQLLPAELNEWMTNTVDA